MTALCASLVYLLMAGPAASQTMPRYDVEAYCRQAADISGGSATIFNGCIDMEQDAYDKRKAMWPSIPSSTRSYDDEVTRLSSGSYSILDGCIDMEMDTASDSNTEGDPCDS